MVKNNCVNPYFCGINIGKDMLKKHIMNNHENIKKWINPRNRLNLGGIDSNFFNFLGYNKRESNYSRD